MISQQASTGKAEEKDMGKGVATEESLDQSPKSAEDLCSYFRELSIQGTILRQHNKPGHRYIDAIFHCAGHTHRTELFDFGSIDFNIKRAFTLIRMLEDYIIDATEMSKNPARGRD